MPRGQYPRFKKVAPAEAKQLRDAAAVMDAVPVPIEDRMLGDEHAEPAITLPAGWAKGAMLNVRNTGADYVVTLYPEEFDPRYPERALRFTNPARCQDFVSNWYARESHDPRAR